MKQQIWPWETAILVWAPILIIGAIYGSIYGITYAVASNTNNNHRAQYNACENNLQQQELQQTDIRVKLFSGQKVSEKDAQRAYAQLGSCQIPGTIQHGFLGIPHFCCDAYD